MDGWSFLKLWIINKVLSVWPSLPAHSPSGLEMYHCDANGNIIGINRQNAF